MLHVDITEIVFTSYGPNGQRHAVPPAEIPELNSFISACRTSKLSPKVQFCFELEPTKVTIYGIFHVSTIIQLTNARNQISRCIQKAYTFSDPIVLWPSGYDSVLVSPVFSNLQIIP